MDWPSPTLYKPAVKRLEYPQLAMWVVMCGRRMGLSFVVVGPNMRPIHGESRFIYWLMNAESDRTTEPSRRFDLERRSPLPVLVVRPFEGGGRGHGGDN